MASIVAILFGTHGVILGTSYAQMNTDNIRMLEQYIREYRLTDDEREDGGTGAPGSVVGEPGEAAPGDDPSGEPGNGDAAAPRGNNAGMSDNSVQGDDNDAVPSGGRDGAAVGAAPGGSVSPAAADAKPPQPDEQPPEAMHKFDVSTFYSVAVSSDGEVLKTDSESGTMYSDETLEEYAENILGGSSDTGKIKSLTYMRAEKDDYTLVAFIDNAIMQGGMATVFRNTLIFGGIAVLAVFVISVFLAKRIVSPLEESFRRQKQFISDAGHELKTPVSVVSANAELLSREIGENQWLANIQYENEKMGSLVRQLLDLAKAESVAPQTERIDFSRIVSGELLPFESVAFEQGLELHSDIADGICVDGDPGRMKQLASILIDNAIRHSEKGSDITVTLKAEHNSAKLSVVNDGREIPPELREHIFERFYRVDTARSDDGHFGLGLAIAKAITDSHKGRISVSCYDGKVEFTVLLPLQRSSADN